MSINGQSVLELPFKDIISLIRTSPRPLRIYFQKLKKRKDVVSGNRNRSRSQDNNKNNRSNSISGHEASLGGEEGNDEEMSTVFVIKECTRFVIYPL